MWYYDLSIILYLGGCYKAHMVALMGLLSWVARRLRAQICSISKTSKPIKQHKSGLRAPKSWGKGAGGLGRWLTSVGLGQFVRFFLCKVMKTTHENNLRHCTNVKLGFRAIMQAHNTRHQSVGGANWYHM